MKKGGGVNIGAKNILLMGPILKMGEKMSIYERFESDLKVILQRKIEI